MKYVLLIPGVHGQKHCLDHSEHVYVNSKFIYKHYKYVHGYVINKFNTATVRIIKLQEQLYSCNVHSAPFAIMWIMTLHYCHQWHVRMKMFNKCTHDACRHVIFQVSCALYGFQEMRKSFVLMNHTYVNKIFHESNL